MEEIWKPILSYEDSYEVSNCGNVRSIDRLIWNGRGYYLAKGMLIKPMSDKDGYLCVSLSNKSNVKRATIHRLVCTAFIENILNLPAVNHKNGIKSDNRIENLEWVTNSANVTHAYRILKRKHPKGMSGKFGKLHHKSIPVNQFSLDGVLVKRWESINQACILGAFDSKTIHGCVIGKYKQHKGFIWNTSP